MSKQVSVSAESHSTFIKILIKSVRGSLNTFKIIWLACWLCIATLLVFPPIIISTLFTSKGNVAFQLSRVWAWIILTIAGVKLSVQGKEKIDKNRTYIIISNHQSHFDGPSIALSLGIQFRWVAKQELLKIPIFGHCLYACGNIFIDRSDREKSLKSLQEGFDRLPQGVGAMFFAEGTRSTNGRLNEFKKGGFFAALQTGLPILPVTVNGSSKALPRNGIIFRSSPIQVIIGDPIEVSGYTADQIDELLDVTREAITANLKLE
ncbi:1-acyl-sn-glycerol-3-phosphate acyltransferase [bacterium]|nr:1-acyl-sn-glycerol-3-phosphate acyltransferase [bacterium]